MGAILQELEKQKLVDEYNEQLNHWAFLAAVITNGFSAMIGVFSKRKAKTFGPDDFMGKDAKKTLQQLLEQGEPKQKDWRKYVEEAKAKDLRGPW